MDKKLFEDGCFSSDWAEVHAAREMSETSEIPESIPGHKDLPKLLKESEQINQNLENIKAKAWHLAVMMRVHLESA